MTREEAITKLHWLKAELIKGTDLNEPLDMAIEALNEADKREQYGQNYEADDFVKLGVTDKNKDKVILYDAFGEKEYYPQTDLVRCKDCRHGEHIQIPLWENRDIDKAPSQFHDFIKCHKFHIKGFNETLFLGDDDYCSHGERKDK